MAEGYTVQKVTTETFIATCNKCQKPFRSDVESKAVKKVQDHIMNCKG